MVTPENVLAYWLDEVGPAGWYAGGEALDAEVRNRFADGWAAAMEGRFGLWLTYPSGALAYVILMDQFPRNMFRDTPKSFASDAIALAAAKQGVANALAGLGGKPDLETDQHPSVQSALAAREKAAYNLSLTTVHAPSDGVLYQAASFRAGQFVAAGNPLFALVATNDTWVDANFKETQLSGIKTGESADVEFDSYPGQTFKGRVAAIGAGTGAEFSLLPAQNATGNWVKVTQRVPVRIALDKSDALPDLRSGLSAKVSVDTGRKPLYAAWLPSAFAGETDDGAGK